MEQNRGEETPRFKKRRGKLGQGVGALKRGGDGTTLQTMDDLILPMFFILSE